MYKLYEVDPDADTLLINTARPPPPAADDASSSSSSSSSSASAYAGLLRGTARPCNIYARISARPETRIKVSSKHLSLASAPLRNKLRHQASDADAADGRRHVTLAGHDAAAVVLVMDMVHGRARRVPAAVGLETLAAVAVFVDAFRCLEPVQVYAERWLARLGPVPPREYGRELVLWIYVAYVFRQGEAFRLATRTAALRSGGAIRTLGLQVRPGVIKEIDLQRQQLVHKALDIVHDAVDALQEETAPCSLGCDTLFLGALIKTLHRAKLVWPRPSKPYAGTSYAQILASVKEAQAQVAQFLPGLHLDASSAAASDQKSRKRVQRSTQPGHALTPDSSPEVHATLASHTCDAQSNIAEALIELEGRVHGLALESKLGYYLY